MLQGDPVAPHGAVREVLELGAVAQVGADCGVHVDVGWSPHCPYLLLLVQVTGVFPTASAA